MKIIGNIGSIRQGSNRIVSSTYADWSAVREGTFVKFDGDVSFYTASYVEKRTFLKAFSAVKSNILLINENCGNNLTAGDTLVISYKEYELNTIYKIINGGSGYKLGEELVVAGGVASLNQVDNTLNSTLLSVIRVGKNGEILELQVKNRGKYFTIPQQITELKGGSGAGAIVETSFKLADHRSFIERDVEKVEFKSSETNVYLVYGLPPGITEGKISVEKWEMVLSSEYAGETKTNQPFQISRDVSPHYKIALLSKNAPNQEIYVNNAIIKLENKIMELEKRIKRLES